MNIVKGIADFFRNREVAGNKDLAIDKYEILSPLLSVQEYVSRVGNLVNLLVSNKTTIAALNNNKPNTVTNMNNGVHIYHEYLNGLSATNRTSEKSNPLSTIVATLTIASKNLDIIENNFTHIFDSKDSVIDETNLRSSSLLIIGYIETVNDFCSWVASLSRHITADTDEHIPPFETKSATINGEKFGSFADYNIFKWSMSNDTILSDIKNMQKKGADVVIKNGDVWIDTFVNDRSFSDTENDLMNASLRSPTMMKISATIAYQQSKLDLLTHRKEWLIAKVALETEKMRGLNPDSQEYKKLRKATEHYANLVSKYEQKIERMHA